MLATRARMAAAGSAGGGAVYAVGSFNPSGSTGTQAVTGIGFTPKALIFWMSGASGTSGTWAQHIRQVVGFTSGPSESYSVAGASGDAQSTSDTARRIAAKAITTVNYSSVLYGEADLSSFDADGFTLDWTDDLPAGFEIMFLAVGGDDVQAKVVNWTSPTSTGNKAVTGVGFQPSVVLHAGVGFTAAPPGSAAGASVGWGAMDAAGGQWTNAVAAEDGQATSNTARYQRTDKALSLLSPSSLAVIEEAAYVSMDADGFTTNFTTAGGSALQRISLCLSGVSAKVGSFLKSTDTGVPVTQAVTGVGFEPSALLLTSVAHNATTAVSSFAAWNMGAGDGTNERTTVQFDADSQATTDAESLWKNDKVLATQDNVSGSVDAEADLTSLDSDGFTLNWTTNGDSEATQILFLCLA